MVQFFPCLWGHGFDSSFDGAWFITETLSGNGWFFSIIVLWWSILSSDQIYDNTWKISFVKLGEKKEFFHL